tara:strand:- start:100 stop:657 length:558 start_codon:yes stop_codon:yes gene_type:complete
MKDFLLKKYLSNTKIQLHAYVLKDIIEEINENTRLLVWGLGYDSELWWNVTNKNTYFIESEDEYINMNTFIPDTHIIKYTYPSMSVIKSLTQPDKVETTKIPESIKNLGLFDVIIVDGPNGNSNSSPGRQLPIYWSINHLSKPNTLIYMDDTNRKLETLCIKRYCKSENIVKRFHHRKGSIKYKV